jgi:hypothetical protein
LSLFNILNIQPNPRGLWAYPTNAYRASSVSSFKRLRADSFLTLFLRGGGTAF